jgi:hypothetical protein
MRPGSVGVLCVLVAAACSRDVERTLSDTEGRRFRLRCQSGVCGIEAEGTSGGAAGKGAFALYGPGRLIGVCDVASGTPPEVRECRPLVCSRDDDCPPAQGLEDGECVNRLCTEPSQPIATADAVMLCLAGTGAGHDAPIQVERFALAVNCGEPCVVPAPCRRP